MFVKIQTWGNSLALRIPKAFARELGLEPGSAVNLSSREGRLIIEKAAPVEYNLEELVAGISEENMHYEVDYGGPRGGEKL